MVRLKGFSRGRAGDSRKFQFLMVRLKAVKDERVLFVPVFQFLMVRLKAVLRRLKNSWFTAEYVLKNRVFGVKMLSVENCMKNSVHRQLAIWLIVNMSKINSGLTSQLLPFATHHRQCIKGNYRYYNALFQWFACLTIFLFFLKK